MPRASEGATPHRWFSTKSRSVTLARSAMAFSRKAAQSLIGALISAVPRTSLLVPTVTEPASIGRRTGVLLTWLITPPVEPRPNRVEAGPL